MAPDSKGCRRGLFLVVLHVHGRSSCIAWALELVMVTSQTLTVTVSQAARAPRPGGEMLSSGDGLGYFPRTELATRGTGSGQKRTLGLPVTENIAC